MDEWTAAEVLKDEFIHNQSQRDIDNTAQLENEAEATIELSASFLAYVAESIAEDQSTHARTALFLNVFKYFTSTYLATKDIYSLTSTFDTDTRKTVLSAYFLAVAALKAREIDASIPKQESALLAAALSKKASVFALFGGQGTNEVYFDELQNLYDIYKPFVPVAPFVQTLTKDILAPLFAVEEASTYYTFGLDVVSWLSGATARPAVSYLASVPISLPLIGLTQLVQYLVVFHVAGLTPCELRSRLSGAMGHSQGIVSAALPSSLQHRAPLKSFPTTPTKTFIVTGPPKALFSLVASLRKVRAQSGLQVDQSKTPFSQQKPIFSVRFLLVGAPYHSEYLDGVTDTVAEEDLEDEELWDAKDLKIPVTDTNDGISLYPAYLGAYRLI